MDGNDTSKPVDSVALHSAEISVTLIILLGLFDIVSIVANGMVLMTVYMNPRLRSNTNVFITNLCLVDLIAGCLLMPLVIDSIGRKEERFGVLCELVGFIDATYSCASSLTIAVIALDRYHSIVNCLYYENIVTRRRTIIAIIWIWLQTLFIAMCPVVGWGHYTYDFAQFKCSLELPDRHGFLWFMFCTSVVFPFSVIVFCYTQIHLVARRHAKNMVAIHIQDTGKRVRAVSTRKTKLVYLVVGLYTTCWLPIYIVKLFQSIDSDITIPPGVITLATVLSLVNGSCNPFLYALITSQYRAGMNRMNKRFRRKFGRTVATPSVEQSKSSWSVSRPISNLYRYFQENDGGNMLACIGKTYADDDRLERTHGAETSQKYFNPKDATPSPSNQRKITPQTLQIPNKTKNCKRAINGWVQEGKEIKSLSIPLKPIDTQNHDEDSFSDPEISGEFKSLTRANSLEKKRNTKVKQRNSENNAFKKAVSFKTGQDYLEVTAVSFDKESTTRKSNSVLSTIKEVESDETKDKHGVSKLDEAEHYREDTTWEKEESGTQRNGNENTGSGESEGLLSDEQLDANNDNRTRQANVITSRNPLDALDNGEYDSEETLKGKDEQEDDRRSDVDETCDRDSTERLRV